jgi:HK97 family phage major capsid protein
MMNGKMSHASDAMIRRLEKELEERTAAVNGIVSTAQDTERDLTQSERDTLTALRDRIGDLKGQLGELEATASLAGSVAERMRQFDDAITLKRRGADQEVQYRSAGAWALDSYKASIGDRQAQERLEVFNRVAAHQKTTDNLGVVPDPVIGGVIKFIDAARPLVSVIGPQSMPGATFHRPRVTQGTSVLVQGAAGAAADEKTELVSQKMIISRLTANAVTYGGYVNVSRQNIDFSSPQIMDIIINDMAQRYAIQTELATGIALMASTSAAVGYGATPTAASMRAALWAAASTIYQNTAGQGRVVLAVSPGRLSTFGPLFVPIVGVSQTGEGLSAGDYSSGLVGSIAGIPVYMSAGLTGTQAVMFSTAAIEVFEQRIGTLQVTEPSVLGVQVAYAGYFTTLRIEDSGIIKLTAT